MTVDTDYAPDQSTDLLKNQFKDRSHDLGVDLAGGDFSHGAGDALAYVAGSSATSAAVFGCMK
ncbi:hypothetical protein [Hydrocarboniphaga sp.]|uniref:hypothetical protein n=1 Tax=Hydrocarboniphaga sp. TaxID=2033016 RepID=UPI00262CAC48|nr:hypothetical protein [Hydrocarboniphaga sp.]